MDVNIAKGILLNFGFTQKQLEIMSHTEIIAIALRIRDKFHK
jgi:hypothetical protein